MKRLTILFLIITTSYCSATAQGNKVVENESDYLKKVLSERIYLMDKHIDIDTLKWNPHPTFKGVYLKHLITGKDTDDKLSCHIVKIDPGCILDTHIHDGKIEFHEVAGGSGIMYLDKQEISYSTGRVCLIPANTPHKVVAGKDGLYLFAKFTPAL
jgi:Uncharacterized conserved protein, contains double-stranded beta-helix domain